ncbi:MAG: hydrogenobyrinic acid a,c-diamide synthase (glutamine-hydrolyzing) [Rhodospirillaceae bacterium]|jgi:cobyrinic acid a,c-diamide synthase|nr:hydrogenobyrinic acid a,c-diamide synthase (glutamine-hydrolyzing) [Rhodospirillaceae bacterium]MBT5309211.1 hydrogenobyrinic acid a,c-diamide synthase (glutamine-hydrolyzing) [Rhodospirillaceae bacterium]MBT6407207.1 hydrogenobyrinic acid a,c-diamide synthase (glutamine-hydrolyzing) [Rhodospirillaceae bacterium]MBT7356026.1 hydrogenobyrinic acid a,c-diamide synthase (glutamine-hydrolyzing) [Rhodospirillaceae bacterium]
MSHILISAAHKSSGKTTISIGLAAALRRRDMKVQTFKKGPDYIDPMWLARASWRTCHNLDYYTMDKDEILSTFARFSRGSDIAIIEGNKGLYDGLDLDGGNSNAALAILVGAPVVLVIDARGMTRGVAPLILGYQAFNKDLNIAGIILNKVGGSRHEEKLRTIIEHFTDVPVVGIVHRDERLVITERHLGLTPSNEDSHADDKIDAIVDLIEAQVDIDKIIEIAEKASKQTPPARPRRPQTSADISIGVARDSAFGFYYPGDLEALEAAGAKLIPIDMTKDIELPEIDGLFIGGGFPETRMKALQDNTRMRKSVRATIENGLPVYAECGGLMYLARSLTWKDETCDMVGVIPADVVLHDKPQGRGYVRLKETGNGPWPLLDDDGNPGEIPAHEFHYSSLENLDGDPVFAYQVLRGHGIDGEHDGLIYKNLLANYTHLRDVSANRWAQRFVGFVRRHMNDESMTTSHGKRQSWT